MNIPSLRSGDRTLSYENNTAYKAAIHGFKTAAFTSLLRKNAPCAPSKALGSVSLMERQTANGLHRLLTSR
jgi:hypothetical protein